jgi:MFS family permease
MPAPSSSTETNACRIGLNGLNFSLAAVQTGFGPFVAVWLTRQGWDETQIGIALSIGTAAGLIGQLPAGLIVEWIPRKRLAVFGAMLALAVAAVQLALPATVPTIWTAQVLHALASAVLTPAIAALTLSICGRAAFGVRLGVNARWASIGNASTGGAMGLIAHYGGEQSVFLASAGLVGVAALFLILMRRVDSMALPPPEAPPDRPSHARTSFLCIFEIPALHIFALCTALFHLANAAMLPLALNTAAQQSDEIDFVVSATIVLPQAIVVLAAPWIGWLAQRWGRKPILSIGFAALPLRAIGFSTGPDAVTLAAWQMLDGVSAAVLGVMLPLIADDLTRKTGHLTMAIASLGLAAGIGATFSTTIAGLVADAVGAAYAFYGLAAMGGLALAIVIAALPETRPAADPDPRTGLAVA